MDSIVYKSSSGISVAFEFADALLKFNFTEGIWLSIARIVFKLLSPIKDLVCKVNQYREAIIIEWEVSKARIKAGKLIEVTKIYEQKKSEVENLSLSFEAKQKLIAHIDRALDLHIYQIIEYGS